MKYLVTNLENTTQRIKQDGQYIWIEPGKTALVENPIGANTPSFRVEPLLEEAYTEQIESQKAEKKLKNKEVKK